MRLPEIAHRRTWQVLIGAPLVICALLLAGCSSRFIYNRLDTLATWYFEGLVSLNDGQRSELRAWLGQTLSWHRQSELTRYAAFITDISNSLVRPGTPETYDSMRVRFQGFIDDLMKKTAPEASKLLVNLSPKQVDELLASLADKTRESTEENAQAMAENEWRPKQAKDLVRQMKRWTGSVTGDQKRLIAATVEQLEPTYEDWSVSQQSWRDALRDALRSGGEGSVEPPQRVVDLLEDPDQQWTAEYSEKVTRNRARYQQLLMDLDSSLSTQQRAHLRNELAKLSQQLSRLAQG
jgi:hypothetical protein